MAKRKKEPIDWVTMGDDGFSFVCRRCGQAHRFELPLEVTAFTHIGNHFIEAHRYCRQASPASAAPPAEPPSSAAFPG